MPSTVSSLFSAARVTPAGVTRWGDPVAPPGPPGSPAIGIYVVALGADPGSLDAARDVAPISAAALDALLAVRPGLTVDRVRPTRDGLAAALAAMWCPDEVVLYVGVAGRRKQRPPEGELAERVAEYHGTPLGASGPHAAGWPVKTLSCPGDLYVHVAYADRVAAAQSAMVARFARDVSPLTRMGLRDRAHVLPFANLEFPKGTAKDHGILGAGARGEEEHPARAPSRPAPAHVAAGGRARAAEARPRGFPTLPAPLRPGGLSPAARAAATMA
ncbi:hypothetical protein FSW04_08180 [Baekduia soli]|uniref:Uncharacterized protein n=1 Tax=Baekduia soli TaxID=496014 RepID=A0A5B8U3C8_9ACTN|nr:hypothetical protein [Baekduia soli]QEC47557.1 hypothetical protein FSW04_08180 [Baekduia soli]